MHCTSCQAELPEPFTRFCEACGIANPHYRPPARPAASAAPLLVRCPECGLPARRSRCRGCGARVTWPEGVTPPDD